MFWRILAVRRALSPRPAMSPSMWPGMAMSSMGSEMRSLVGRNLSKEKVKLTFKYMFSLTQSGIHKDYIIRETEYGKGHYGVCVCVCAYAQELILQKSHFQKSLTKQMCFLQKRRIISFGRLSMERAITGYVCVCAYAQDPIFKKSLLQKILLNFFFWQKRRLAQSPKFRYRVAKTHRISYLYMSFSSKVTYI